MKTAALNLAIHGKRTLTLVKTNYSEMTDTELVVACQRKDEVALKHLLQRYERIIAMMIRRLAPDWKNNADLTQEVFIRVWRSIGQLRNPNSFRTWLNQIVTNLFYDQLRKQPHPFRLVSIDEPLTNEDGSSSGMREIVDNSPQPEAKLINNELSEALMQAVSRIPKNFRIAAILRDIEGLSYEEIATATSTELGTVKSRIARARLKIQEQLSPYLKDCA